MRHRSQQEERGWGHEVTDEVSRPVKFLLGHEANEEVGRPVKFLLGHEVTEEVNRPVKFLLGQDSIECCNEGIYICSFVILKETVQRDCLG